MKKIISLFKRDYIGTRLVYNEVVIGAEWVINGEGIVLFCRLWPLWVIIIILSIILIIKK